MPTNMLSEEVVLAIDSVLRNHTEKLAKAYAFSALGRGFLEPTSFVIGLTVISEIADTVREMAPDSASILYMHHADVVLRRIKREFDNVWLATSLIRPDLDAFKTVDLTHRDAIPAPVRAVEPLAPFAATDPIISQSAPRITSFVVCLLTAAIAASVVAWCRDQVFSVFILALCTVIVVFVAGFGLSMANESRPTTTPEPR